MTVISGADSRHKLLLDEARDLLKVDEVSLKGRVAHLKDVKQALQAHLHVLVQVELCLPLVKNDPLHLQEDEESVVLQDLLGSDPVICKTNLIEEVKGEVGRKLRWCELDRLVNLLHSSWAT